MSRSQKVTKLVQATGIPEARGESDTVKLWENFREQAGMWRAIALFQMPTTLLLVIFSIVLWSGRSITLSVPAKPLPGKYLVQQIPDTEFIEYATNFVNLIASYQPAVARRQFNQAREMLVEPMLSRFDQEMMDIELKAIETTNRTQVFFIDPTVTAVERLSDKEIMVTFEGERQKMVAGKELPEAKARYTITMSSVPRQTINPYGIVVTNAGYETLDRKGH